MFDLGKRRWRASAVVAAGVTALALTLTGSGVHAAPTKAPGKDGARAISNDLVKIKPAKVKGTYADPDSSAAGRVVAKFVPEEFLADDGALTVAGTLTGRFAGKLPKGQQRHFSEPFAMAVLDGSSPGEATTGAFRTAAFVPAETGCDILHLNLGPLDLDLLGLEIDLAEVVLDIVAQPGAGNLLGNLLCAVAGLLDGSPLGGLLDGVIAALQGLLDGLLDLDAILDQLGGGAARTQSA